MLPLILSLLKHVRCQWFSAIQPLWPFLGGAQSRKLATVFQRLISSWQHNLWLRAQCPSRPQGDFELTSLCLSFIIGILEIVVRIK